MKEKASESINLDPLAKIIGAGSGDLRCLLGAHGRGSNSLQLHL